MSQIQYRLCEYNEILPLKGADAKYLGFQYKEQAIYIGAFCCGEIVGCCGYIVKKDKIEFVNDVVKSNYRKKGIYSTLFNIRKNIVASINHKKEYAYCTKMSVGRYISDGFKVKKEFTNTYKLEKDL